MIFNTVDKTPLKLNIFSKLDFFLGDDWCRGPGGVVWQFHGIFDSSLLVL